MEVTGHYVMEYVKWSQWNDISEFFVLIYLGFKTINLIQLSENIFKYVRNLGIWIYFFNCTFYETYRSDESKTYLSFKTIPKEQNVSLFKILLTHWNDIFVMMD